MVTLTVEIDQEKDLSVIQALLNRLDIKYHMEMDEQLQLSAKELERINAGLEDIKAGRVFSFDEVKKRIDQKMNQLRGVNER